MQLVYPFSGTRTQSLMPRPANKNSVMVPGSRISHFPLSTRPPADITGCTRRVRRDADWKLGRQPRLGHRAKSPLIGCRAEGSSYYRPEFKPPKTSNVKSELLKQVTAVVYKLGGAVTTGDVSAHSGVPVQEAEDALATLVGATGGTLQVKLLDSIPSLRCNAGGWSGFSWVTALEVEGMHTVDFDFLVENKYGYFHSEHGRDFEI